jgi:hypothetical protein
MTRTHSAWRVPSREIKSELRARQEQLGLSSGSVWQIRIGGLPEEVGKNLPVPEFCAVSRIRIPGVRECGFPYLGRYRRLPRRRHRSFENNGRCSEQLHWPFPSERTDLCKSTRGGHLARLRLLAFGRLDAKLRPTLHPLAGEIFHTND